MLSALALSTLHEFARPGLLAALAAWLVAAVVAWRWRGRPRPVPVRPRLRWLAHSLRRTPTGFLAVALGAGYAYLVALGLFTPQNDSDPLVYQLARAAIWRQNEGIGIIDVPIEPRLDVNPIVAEVGQVSTLIMAGNEQFVWLVQLPAVAALALGAFALARRAGIPARGALFSAMLVPALPVVATQAISGYNDLVAASFVITATVFVLGRGRAELVPFTLAVALAIGTKFTTPFALPVVALVGMVGQPLRRWPTLLGAGVAGAILGGGWYVVNIVRTGFLDGGLASFAHQQPVLSIPSIAFSIQRLLLDSLELPGPPVGAQGCSWRSASRSRRSGRTASSADGPVGRHWRSPGSSCPSRQSPSRRCRERCRRASPVSGASRGTETPRTNSARSGRRRSPTAPLPGTGRLRPSSEWPWSCSPSSESRATARDRS